MAARKKTARKKGVPASRAPATRMSSALDVPGNLSPEWRQKLEKYAKRDAATATGATGWPYIGTRGGVFHFNEDELEELPTMVILGARFENCFYEGEYDSNSTNPPDCFAIAEEEDDLAPPESLGDRRECMQSDPTSEKCDGCWANAFKTAVRGRGKACKNVRRLALLPADRIDAKNLSKVEGAMLRIPVTSVKNYSSFANKVTKGLGLPLFAMPCSIGIEPDEANQFKVTFEPAAMRDTDKGAVPLIIADDDLLDVLETRDKESQVYLDQHPVLSSESDATPKRKGGRKRAAARNGRATTKPGRKKVASRSKRKTTTRKAGARAKF
jgi:hypothetical protein